MMLNVVVLQMVHHVSAIALKIHHTFLGKMAGFHLWSQRQKLLHFYVYAFHSALLAQTLEAKNNSNNNENELKKELKTGTHH